MDTLTLNLQLTTIPPLMRRGRHALILVRNQEGNFILGRKQIYPPQICRMVGGGIEASEDPQVGAARELAEELHIDVPPENLIPLKKVVAEITCRQEKITFTTWLFFYQLEVEAIQADDDLDDVWALSEADLESLIARYGQLQGEDKDDNVEFKWQDYGRLYGPMHQIALDAFHGLK